MCLNQPDPCIAVRIDDDPSIQWLIYDQYTFQAKAYAERNQAWHWVGDLVSLGSEQKHHAEECLHSYSYSKLQRIPESLNIYRTGSCLHFLRPSLEFVRQQLSAAEN